MSDLTPYTTNEGDTWSLIAYLKLGDHNRTDIIIAANPGIPNTPRLAGGITVYIPVLTEDEARADDKELLPPWRQ